MIDNPLQLIHESYKNVHVSKQTQTFYKKLNFEGILTVLALWFIWLGYS